MIYEVSFPGGLRVDATVGNHVVHTDQPERAGGNDTAPAPFDLFIASSATCMGLYALVFCRERGLSTDGLGLSVETIRDVEKKRVATVKVNLTLPEGFPEKYREAIHRAIDQCAVKRHIFEPPAFEFLSASVVH